MTIRASNYTPTTEQVRDVYLFGCVSVDEKQELDVPEALAMFDRWRESLAEAFEVAAAPFVATLRRELLEARELLQTRADHAGRLADEIAALKPRVVTTVAELIMLPEESIIRGPDWHGEVYQKSGDVEYFGIASAMPWLASNLQPRGPFTIIFTPVAPS